MSEFRFVTPVAVRFGDLDTLGHVNNVPYVRYLEEGRADYYDEVVGAPLESTGTVIAELHVEYRNEITRGQTVEVAVRVPELGDSSVPMEYEIRTSDPETEADEATVAAEAETVQVNTDRETGEAAPVPESWRTAIREFENW
jgi:acyl-CoA thioester hydrolase